MKIITVSGAQSKVGKTTFIEGLLKGLKDWSCLKVTLLHNGVCPTARECGACKDISPEGYSIVSNPLKLAAEGKDTQRFKKAGAKEVLWLKAGHRGLEQGLKKSLSKFKAAKGIIIEGTSILKYLQPDLAIMVQKNNSVLKPSAQAVLNKIDLIVTV